MKRRRKRRREKREWERERRRLRDLSVWCVCWAGCDWPPTGQAGPKDVSGGPRGKERRALATSEQALQLKGPLVSVSVRPRRHPPQPRPKQNPRKERPSTRYCSRRQTVPPAFCVFFFLLCWLCTDNDFIIVLIHTGGRYCCWKLHSAVRIIVVVSVGCLSFVFPSGCRVPRPDQMHPLSGHAGGQQDDV